MTGGFWGFLGGIGLFLFGMETMTAALRALAGEGLRQWLLRMTSTPLRGVVTGAAITALVQSSTAVTVMTIGFVGVGMMGITQSLGVIYGANIGTTMTGWLIMLAGVKLQLGVVALPTLFIAALMGILGEGPLARAGRMLAGLSLMFIGLDLMQASTDGIEKLITPEILPAEGWLGRLALVGIGLVVVTVVQSSSAGLAMALVLLGSGAISFGQAAAILIGLNIGTTLTGLLASLGGGPAMRRAALASLLFNLGTALLVFPFLGMLSPLLHSTAAGNDDLTAFVLFHTAFNLVGAAVFLPLTQPFARFLQWLVPDRPVTLAAALDPQLLSDPGTALDAASQTAKAIAGEIGRALQSALAAKGESTALETLPSRVQPALSALEAWLMQLHLPADQQGPLDRMAALMHMADHLSRLTARMQERDRIEFAARDPRLYRPSRAVAAALARPATADQAARLAARIRGFALRHRRGALLREHAGMIAPSDVFKQTDALRWLDRVAEHVERITFYAAQAGGRNG